MVLCKSPLFSETENLHTNVILGSIFVFMKRRYIILFYFVKILETVYEVATVKLSKAALW